MIIKLKPLLALLVLSIGLSGCSHSNNNPSPTVTNLSLHEFRLQDANTKQDLSVSELAKQVQNADVVFIGEYHTHSASHLLQAQLLTQLHQNNPNLVLSMEQFTRDKQSLVDQYLKNEIGEQTLIKQGDAWDNYQSDYRPLVEFAREHKLPVVAANTPINLVRCVAKQGPEVLDKLSGQNKGWIAQDISSSSNKYQQKFSQAMGGHGSAPIKKSDGNHQPVKLSNSFYAQLARDNTMAESIYLALQKQPNSLVVHTNGAFHSDNYLGTVDALKRLDPSLMIKVISPQFTTQAEDWDKGDYIYTIKPMPTRYVKKENRDKAIRAMMAKRKGSKCELE